MRSFLPCAALALAMAVPAAAEPAEDVLLSERDLGGAWQIVREAPEDASADPDLVAWGVRARRTRHYTRDERGTARVCSIEVWAFRSEAQARAAGQGFAFPHWEIARERTLLVMVRGLTRPRGQRPQRGIFPACRALGNRVRARAAAL